MTLEHFPYLGLFAALVLGGLGLPFPEDATLMLCGFLISNGAVRALYALPVVYAGMLAGDMLVYYWGARYGRRLIKMRRFGRLLTPERLKKAEESFRGQGAAYILLGRHLIGLRVQIFLAAGITGMPPLKFLISDAFSALITLAIMAGAGYAGGSSINILRKDLTRVEHIGVLLAILLFICYLIYSNVKARKEARRGS